MLDLARRSFLTGLAGMLICSPAIVRASSLMALKKLSQEWETEYHFPPSITIINRGSRYAGSLTVTFSPGWTMDAWRKAGEHQIIIDYPEITPGGVHWGGRTLTYKLPS